MVRKEEKISDETIQLYLMGELAGPLFDRIRSIDEAPDPTVLSAADSVIRQTITKLRSWIKCCKAADTSFKCQQNCRQRSIGSRRRQHKTNGVQERV